MAKTVRCDWTPRFWENCPCFAPVSVLQEHLSQYSNNWPSLADLQGFLDQVEQPIRTLGGSKLTVVAQEDRHLTFEEHYAPRIYLRGEMQTRTRNWHDFFQVVSWRLFPATKAAINARHFHAAKHRNESFTIPGRRSPIENLLSLFDECGAIIVSNNPALLHLIESFQWKELFWHNRNLLRNELNCIVFGHAFYEKLVNPYIGMTANCLLLAVDESWMKLPMAGLLETLDEQLARYFMDASRINTPHDLTPFPVLGLPGWHPDNEREEFYDNADYFRTQRRRSSNTGNSHSKIIYVDDN